MTCISVPGFFISEAASNEFKNRRITNKIYLTYFESLIYIAQKEKEKWKCPETTKKNLSIYTYIVYMSSIKYISLRFCVPWIFK